MSFITTQLRKRINENPDFAKTIQRINLYLIKQATCPLSPILWRECYILNVKRRLEKETTAAEEALDSGDLYSYVETLLLWHVRVLRNQIFHGCSTNWESLNKDAVDPALRVLGDLIPVFVDVMEARVDQENEWPGIPFPRQGSPQHRTARGHRP